MFDTVEKVVFSYMRILDQQRKETIQMMGPAPLCYLLPILYPALLLTGSGI